MLKQTIFNNIKNIWGYKTSRKIVVISVDDYGNVRLDSQGARKNMNNEGLKVKSRFDAFDTLETKEDLEMLYETLTSVKDKHGRHAVLTPFSLCCNIDFEAMEANNYTKYIYELLPITFEKLANKDKVAYDGTWKLWKEGIEKKIFVPQYHGREHMNLKVFEEKLAKVDKQVLIALKNRSYTSITNSGYSSINYTAAFDFWDPTENLRLKEILVDGIDKFKEVFGYAPSHFMPPTSKIHESHLSMLKEKGINYIDTNQIHLQHQGFGKYKKSYNYTGKRIKSGQVNLVRNVVFEPTDDRGINWVDYSLAQIEAAFRWGKPAIISSHRVNFGGHIDPENRLVGINALKTLLKKITQKWPDVEFMAANELGDFITKN